MDLATGEEAVPPIPFGYPNGKTYALNLWNNVIFTTTSQGCAGNPNQIWALNLSDPLKKVMTFIAVVAAFASGCGKEEPSKKEPTSGGKAGQGKVTEREHEHLGRSDRGIIVWRRILQRELRAIAEGRQAKKWRRAPADVIPRVGPDLGK